ncbi:DUF4123 domain-containing protein [Paracoccus caeni]|uniref:DUF4123 domain-containing protein n=1 Tax=Paracoccus caeni TaxID=657651 RepID=A0A934SCX5_9RHOB|nr:DUF4123 domain-containing protein [Paracoccus caeni]MBK4215607.1 DUF4123 domain-containing protein [Paracoccus caeni]
MMPDVSRSACSSTAKIHVIDGVEPLGTQIGVFPKRTIPEALREVLFGQQDMMVAGDSSRRDSETQTAPPLQTYAVLDAAKVANLPELLEDSGLEHRCLFKGDAYETLKNVAPWIVRLEEESHFTRSLFTQSKASWHLWSVEPGIFLRSRHGLDEVWRHFRKFTRTQNRQGKWFYNRFWDAGAPG